METRAITFKVAAMSTYANRTEEASQAYTPVNARPAYAGQKYGQRAQRRERRYGALAKSAPAQDVSPRPARPRAP